MKKGDKVNTDVSVTPGTVRKIYHNGTIDVTFRGSKAYWNLPVANCKRIMNYEL